MRNLLYIVGVGLVLKAFIEKYLKTYIKEFMINTSDGDLDRYSDFLFSLLTSCFVGVVVLSYYILSKPEPQVPQVNKAEFLSEIMKKRRSITPKHYNQDMIEDSDIHHILECANTAPTHGKNEPWRYIVYNRETLNQFFDFVRKWYQENGKKAFKSEEEEKKVLSNLDNKLKDIGKASHIIIICMKRYAKENSIMPEWEEIAAIGASVQNIYLQTAAKGLAGYWSSMTFIKHARDSQEMLNFLNLSHNEDRVFGSFVIGKVSDLTKFSRIPGDYKQKIEFR